MKGKNFLFTIFFLIFFPCFIFSCKQKNIKRDIVIVSSSWTGITIKTAVLSEILKSLGYNPEEKIISVPTIYESLSCKNADIFLGYWYPSMEILEKKYFKSGSVINYSINMKGARYTLAVPNYVAKAGFKNFSDICKYGRKLDYKIYGIEKGNDGNLIIKKMIIKNMFHLKSFKLIGSSESAMLFMVKKAVKQKKWIVFLAWSPHQMNKNIKLTYLNGSDKNTFGENNGESTIYTNVRKGFVGDFPEVAKLLSHFYFTIGMMNEIMDKVGNHNVDPRIAAMDWLKKNPSILKNWLNGVKDVKKNEALVVFQKYLRQHY